MNKLVVQIKFKFLSFKKTMYTAINDQDTKLENINTNAEWNLDDCVIITIIVHGFTKRMQLLYKIIIQASLRITNNLLNRIPPLLLYYFGYSKEYSTLDHTMYIIDILFENSESTKNYLKQRKI